MQGPGGGKTLCAQILRGRLDWHIEGEREPGTGCGSMIMIFLLLA